MGGAGKRFSCCSQLKLETGKKGQRPQAPYCPPRSCACGQSVDSGQPKSVHAPSSATAHLKWHGIAPHGSHSNRTELPVIRRHVHNMSLTCAHFITLSIRFSHFLTIRPSLLKSLICPANRVLYSAAAGKVGRSKAYVHGRGGGRQGACGCKTAGHRPPGCQHAAVQDQRR